MSATVVIRSLVRTADPRLDEAQLLTAAAAGDGPAFAELVRRHGPVVLGVCRRVLGPTADADDAFQTTFLALAECAHAIRVPATLPGWLHRTAFRAALKLKTCKPVPSDVPEPAVNPEPLAALSWKEIRALLDEELNALPEHLRAPLVLCYLDGRTRDDAASALKVSLSTLKRRVSDGLSRLNRRLTRRGVSGLGLAAAVLGGSGQGLSAPVPAALLQRVVAVFTARPPVAGVGLFSVASWKVAVSVVLLAGGLAAGAALAPFGAPGQTPPTKEEQAKKADAPTAPTDAFGDPLPAGATLRLGSALFRHAGLRDFVLLPDGQSVLSAGSDGLLRTWNLSTGREIRQVAQPASLEWLGSLSPDGRYAAGFVEKKLVVFDTGTGKELASFPAPGKDVHSTFFSPDGATLAVLTWEPRITLVEWGTQKRREFPLPARTIGRDSTFHGYFSKNGKWVVAGGGSDQSVCVFDVGTGKETHRLNCSIAHSTITPDGATLVASVCKPNGVRGSELVTFDLTTGREAVRFDLGTRGHYYSLDVSPDGKAVACGFSDESCLVDLGSGRVLHELSDRPIGVAFTRDGKHVVGTTGQKLRVWNAANGKELLARPGNFGNLPVLAASPDGRWLTSGDWIGKGVAVWDLTDGRLVRTQPFRGEEGRYVRELGFSRDGRTMWAGGYKGFVQWWDPAAGKELRSVQLDTPVRNVPKLNYLYRVRVSADGKTAAALARVWTPAESTGFVVWDIAGGKVRGERSLPAEQREWAWTEDEAVVALSTADGLVVADGTDPSRTRFTVPGVAANAPIAFSPDGRLLAARKTADKEPNAGEVLVVEVASGRVAATVKTGPVDHLALASRRTLVVTGGGSLKVFDVVTGREYGRRSLPAAVTRFLLPDDNRALTVLADGTGLVWDLTVFTVLPKASSETTAELWDALADKNAAVAHRVGWELVERPTEAVTLLRKKLKPARPADEATVKALVAKLDDQAFTVREESTKALQALGTAAAPALRSALKGNPSAEQADRIKRLLVAMSAPVVPPGDRLRELRAVAVLERTATAEARALLGELAGGVTDDRLTREAVAALDRLKRRSK